MGPSKGGQVDLRGIVTLLVWTVFGEYYSNITLPFPLYWMETTFNLSPDISEMRSLLKLKFLLKFLIQTKLEIPFFMLSELSKTIYLKLKLYFNYR